MSTRNIMLQDSDEIFSTEEMRQSDKRERVRELSPEELKPFKEHPFQVRENGGRKAQSARGASYFYG